MKTYQRIYQKLKGQTDYVSGEELARDLALSRTSIWKAIQKLEDLGLVIDSQKKRGYKILEGDLLDADRLSQDLGLAVFFKEETTSTQQEAKELADQGYPQDFLFLTAHQTRGKGRFDRPFYSNKTGGIYMTLRLQPATTYDEIPAYTILTVAACHKAILDLTGRICQIKWVNDLYLDGKKIAGILTEATGDFESGQVSNLFIGLGLNFCIKNFPPNLQETAGSLFKDQAPISRNQLISAIWKNLLTIPEEQLIQIYKDNSLVLGKVVSFEKKGFTYKGQAIALSNNGHLLVELKDGEQMWLSSGEISLSSW